jgi:hypothetical protein
MIHKPKAGQEFLQLILFGAGFGERKAFLCKEIKVVQEPFPSGILSFSSKSQEVVEAVLQDGLEVTILIGSSSPWKSYTISEATSEEEQKLKEDLKMEKQVVQVRLRESIGRWTSKQYDYLTLEPVALDDIVVVATQYGPQVGLVSGFEKATVKCMKYVIQKVDFTKVDAIIAREKELVSLRQKIRDRANVVRKNQELMTLAMRDSRLMELVEELQKAEAGE